MSNPPEPAIDAQPEGLGSDFDTRVREHAQWQLFANEELVIPPSLQSMRKAVSAIHATPVKAEHAPSLNGRRLFDAIILVAQLDFRRRGPGAMDRVKADGVSPVFETRISELVRLAGIPGKNYERVYDDLDNLFDMSLQWNIVGEDASIEWEMKSHFLSSLGYGRGQKRGLVRYSIDPSILPIVLEPSNWATLSLQALADLGTAASYALYQATFRYITTANKVTAALPLTTWMELLAPKSRYVVVDAKGNKTANAYADFKRRILIDSIRRVNESPALGYTLELREIKSGTKVTKLQFKFVAKPSAGLGVPLTWPQDVLAALEGLGLSPKEIEDLSQAHSYEVVAESLVKLKVAESKIRTAGKSISSRRAYFLGILSNLSAGAEVEDVDHERLEAEAKAAEAQLAAAARQERLRQEFQRHQGERFSRAVFELPEAERADLVTAFEATAQGQKAKILLARGWSPSNAGALSFLRAWMGSERSTDLDRLMPNPEDRDYEAWLAWRADRAG